MRRETIKITDAILRNKRDKAFLVLTPTRDYNYYPIVLAHDYEIPGVINGFDFSTYKELLNFALTDCEIDNMSILKPAAVASGTATIIKKAGWTVAGQYLNFGTNKPGQVYVEIRTSLNGIFGGAPYGPYYNGDSIADVPAGDYWEIVATLNGAAEDVYCSRLRIFFEAMEFLDCIEDIGSVSAQLTGGIGIAKAQFSAKIRNTDYRFSELLSYIDLRGVKADIVIGPENAGPEDYLGIHGGTIRSVSGGDSININISGNNRLEKLFPRLTARNFGVNSDIALSRPFGDFSDTKWAIPGAFNVADPKRTDLIFQRLAVGQFANEDQVFTFTWDKAAGVFNITDSSGGTDFLTGVTTYTIGDLTNVEYNDVVFFTLKITGDESFLVTGDIFTVWIKVDWCRCPAVKIVKDTKDEAADQIWAAAMYPVKEISDVSVQGYLQHSSRYTASKNIRYLGKQISTIDFTGKKAIGMPGISSEFTTFIDTGDWHDNGGGDDSDLSITGTYTGEDLTTIVIQVQAGDTFRWRKTPPDWIGENIDMNIGGEPVKLFDDISVSFSTGGHAVDAWWDNIKILNRNDLQIKGTYSGTDPGVFEIKISSLTPDHWQYKKSGEENWSASQDCDNTFVSIGDGIHARIKNSTGHSLEMKWTIPYNQIDIVDVAWAGKGIIWNDEAATKPAHIIRAFMNFGWDELHEEDDLIDIASLIESSTYWDLLGFEWVGMLPTSDISYENICLEILRCIADLDASEGIIKFSPIRPFTYYADIESDDLLVGLCFPATELIHYRNMYYMPSGTEDEVNQIQNDLMISWGNGFGGSEPQGGIHVRHEQSISEFGERNGHLRAMQTPVTAPYCRTFKMAYNFAINWLYFRAYRPKKVVFDTTEPGHLRLQLGDEHIKITALGIPNLGTRTTGLTEQQIRLTGYMKAPTTNKTSYTGEIWLWNDPGELHGRLLVP